MNELSGKVILLNHNLLRNSQTFPSESSPESTINLPYHVEFD